MNLSHKTMSSRKKSILKPIRLPISEKDRERFLAQYGSQLDPNACHPWAGGSSGERGRFYLQGETRYAYRVAWLLAGREIPAGMDLLNRCGNLACCNFRHYDLGIAKLTTGANIRERFFAMTKTTSLRPYGLAKPCLFWTGVKTKAGYGKMRYQGRLR